MSKERLRAVFFLGEKKQEKLIIAGRMHTVPIGTILKCFLDTNNSFFQDVSLIADALLALSTKAREVESEYTTDIFEAIKTAKSILELSAPILLKELLFLLPAHDGFAEALRKEDKVQFSRHELEEFEYKLLNDGRTPQERTEDIRAFFERRNAMRALPARTARWRRWLTDLVRNTSFEELSYNLNHWQDWEEMLEIIQQYSSNLHSISVEATMLKRTIALAVGIEETRHRSRTEIFEELIDSTGSATLMSMKEENVLFPDCSGKENNRGYAMTSLSALVSLEMQLCNRNHFEFRRCEFCGGYYATHNSKSKYCKYPNETYGGRTCQKVAPQKVHWDNIPLGDEYLQSYSKYRRWINRTVPKDGKKSYNYMNKILEELLKREGEKKREAVITLIKREMDSVFNTWDDNAKTMLGKYKAGMVTEEECRAALVVPPVSNRSPILASRVDDSVKISEEAIEKEMNKPVARKK